MADVQLEHGYVRIAHDLLRALMRAKLSEREKSIVLSVIDRTWGDRGAPREAKIGLGMLAADCGIERKHVSAVVSDLVEKGVLSRRVDGQKTAVLGVVKDYDLWHCDMRQVSPQRGTPRVPSAGDTQATPPVSPQRGTPDDDPPRVPSAGDRSVPSAGDTMKTETRSKPSSLRSDPHSPLDEHFDAFWSAYPRKVSKGQARKTWAKLNPDDALLADILAGLERAVRLDSRFAEPRFTPHASTWLNDEGWTDEHAPAQHERSTHAGTNGSRSPSAVERVEQATRERAAARERAGRAVEADGEDVRPPLEGEFRRLR